MQSIDLSVCTYAVCVHETRACADDGFFTTVWKFLIPENLQQCNQWLQSFSFLAVQGYHCSLIPDAAGVTAGHQLSLEEDSPMGIALVHRGDFYPSLSCSLGPDWGTHIHALQTLLILYIVKWK